MEGWFERILEGELVLGFWGEKERKWRKRKEERDFWGFCKGDWVVIGKNWE